LREKQANSQDLLQWQRLQQDLSALRSQVDSLTSAQAQQKNQATTLQYQLQEADQRAEQLQAKEQQLQKELQEQREKNDVSRLQQDI